MQTCVGGTDATAEVSTARVAVAAVDLHVAGVELVAIGHRLRRLVADLGVPGREEVPDERDGTDEPERRAQADRQR